MSTGAPSKTTDWIQQVTGTITTTAGPSAQLPTALGPTTPAGSLSTTPALATTGPTSLDDVVATSSAQAFGSLAAGPEGIMITALLSNPSGSVVRIDSAPTTTHGMPFSPGTSRTFRVTNASLIKYIIGAGAAGTLSASAV